ncbi:phage head-tail connector protein [Pedosphaera parvula]|uniref:Phage gp6-like head-tail connector protein n=1 Tax=Pedosphaera parvula (strain Ellin514) TaxID=320771 RepID=B9XDF0_PEDPL|nr:phage head-tail connector protein [Pedosphaera parvula]EEF62096.1 hypothetical protein Cflav_PD6371 [Pedosphaera parvula Ellin514]
MTPLTQLTTLKARLGLDAFDTKDDALLTNALRGLSQRIESECNRSFERQTGATFDFRACETEICVDRYPVDAVTGFAIKTSEAEGWVFDFPAPQYFISPARSVIELESPLGSYRQLGRVIFNGGYVLPGNPVNADQTALPDDLEQAVIEQAAYWYQRRNQLGLISISGDGGSIQQFRSLDLLPNVQAVVRNYERFMM